MSLFSSIFETEVIPPPLNQTFISMIPKQSCTETIYHYRPINLCNTIYKISTKIIVSRLRPLLYTIIDPLQSSFQPNRRASDNFIIVQETLNCFHKRSKNQTSYVAIKLDIEKAFDKIE